VEQERGAGEVRVVKAVAKRLAEWFAGPYGIYVVLRSPDAGATGGVPALEAARVGPVDADGLRAAPAETMQSQAWYCGPGSMAFAYRDGTEILGVCVFWFGERYATRNFWPLREGEAKLVQIVVVPEARGRGIAGSLIAVALPAMSRAGFRTCYARVWHSNAPSLKAFLKAGWTRVAWVAEVFPFRSKWRWRFRWRFRDSDRSA
jgi:RimJ/RimL family protein N-acetyltransferase